jgi:hypothetical protein
MMSNVSLDDRLCHRPRYIEKKLAILARWHAKLETMNWHAVSAPELKNLPALQLGHQQDISDYYRDIKRPTIKEIKRPPTGTAASRSGGAMKTRLSLRRPFQKHVQDRMGPISANSG